MYEFNQVVKKMREFFHSRGFIEVHPQDRLSILAACEDPTTISTFDYAGQTWPLPQTNQMWLEHEILTNPEVKGLFCVTTSYRNEANPIPGRHDLIFPLFEFETHGGMETLLQLEKDLLTHLGYDPSTFAEGDYKDVCTKYGVHELDNEHEERLEQDYGPVFFLKNFPQHTSPFWNMKKGEADTYKKIDVILSGIETFGSAERSTNVEEMRDDFYNISDGLYAKLLYSKFSKQRVDAELEKFLSYNFIERCGGGIGVGRLVKSMKKLGLL